MTKGKMSKSEIGKWFIIILFVALMVLIFGCNPVKQVLKSQEKTEEVVRQYVKTNPPKNDTAFIPGDTLTITKVVVDSIPLPYPVNHKYTETHYIDRTVTDTVKVIDRSFIDALNNRLSKLELEFAEMQADRDRWKGAAQVRLYWLIGLIVIIVGAGVFYIIKVLQPKITLMK